LQSTVVQGNRAAALGIDNLIYFNSSSEKDSTFAITLYFKQAPTPYRASAGAEQAAARHVAVAANRAAVGPARSQSDAQLPDRDRLRLR